MHKIKQALKSRTVLLAVGQGVLAVVTAILTEADIPAGLLIVKSIADIALRYDTTEPMSEK